MQVKRYYILALPLMVFITVFARHDQELDNHAYEAVHNPLVCRAFDIQLHGGIAPIVWQERGELAGVNCPPPIPDQSPLIKGLDFPQFKQFYRLPWTIGGQVGYSYSEHIRFYFDFNYVQARPKCSLASFLVLPDAGAPAGTTIDFTVSNYALWDMYLGTRYYSHRWCDRVDLYLGGKIGFTKHKRTGFSLQETIPNVGVLILLPPSLNSTLFKCDVVGSFGVNIGFDVALGDHCNFVVTGELVVCGGPRNNTNFMVMPNFPVPTKHVLITHIGTELRFPVTAALRYNF